MYQLKNYNNYTYRKKKNLRPKYSKRIIKFLER